MIAYCDNLSDYSQDMYDAAQKCRCQAMKEYRLADSSTDSDDDDDTPIGITREEFMKQAKINNNEKKRKKQDGDEEKVR